MTESPRRVSTAVIGGALFATVTALPLDSAVAAGKGLRATLVLRAPDLDGVPAEWSAEFRELGEAFEGASSGARDVAARAALAYDGRYLYVAASVEDDSLVAGKDHVELVVGVPGGAVEAIGLYPGDAFKSRAFARTASGRTVPGSKVVEAPTATGYTLEAAIPWSALPRSDRVRVGFRGAVRVHDVDASGPTAVVATSTARTYGALPALSTEPELSLGANLLRKEGLTMAPKVNLLADVVGDAMFERVLVYDRYLVVLGPTYRGGSEYFFRDLGPGAVVSVTAADTNGDRRDDLRVTRRTPSGDLVEVFAFVGDSEVPSVLSSERVGAKGAAGPSPAARPSPEPSAKPSSPRDIPRGDPSVRDTPTGVVVVTRREGEGGDPERVYALYRTRRGVDGPPRFDVSGDLAEDPRAERLVVHGLDLVVFGAGFRSGRSFAALTLPAELGELEAVLLRDVDGDGKSEVAVTQRRGERVTTTTYRVRDGQLEPVR